MFHRFVYVYQRVTTINHHSYPGWWLTYPSEKYDFVSWDDEIPNWMESHKSNVPNHQPEYNIIWYHMICYDILYDMMIMYVYIYIIYIYILLIYIYIYYINHIIQHDLIHKTEKCMQVCFVFPDVNHPSLMIHIWVGGFPKSQPGMGCNQPSLGCCFFLSPIQRPKNENNWLVVSTLWKILVSWDDSSQYMEK